MKGGETMRILEIPKVLRIADDTDILVHKHDMQALLEMASKYILLQHDSNLFKPNSIEDVDVLNAEFAYLRSVYDNAVYQNSDCALSDDIIAMLNKYTVCPF